MAQAVVTTTIQQEYEERFAASAALHQRARAVIPGGITHDGRRLSPFPAAVARAAGAHKWSVDGHELIDYAVGHGSLILGHGNPTILEAMHGQLERGTHYGAGHESEVRWAELVGSLVPCAEQVRFTASGTESTLLAMRLARAYTNRPVILKLEGHFHGWNDYALRGEKPPFASPSSPGIPDTVLATVAVLPANDPAAIEARLAQGDVAAVIVEPSGASWATIPLVEDYLRRLRDQTSAHGAVLIFDEVITGFRWSPGGAQARYGVTPDLTTLAKIVAGGMPGGAVVGQRAIMDHLTFKDEPGWNATRKIRHMGTYNANPLAAAAGIACLEQCADGAVQQRCDELAARLRRGLNEVFERHDAPGFAFGESSVFHVALGVNAANRQAGDLRFPEGVDAATLKEAGGPLADPLHLGMLLEGVDFFHSGGFLSTAHTEADIDHTLRAFDRVLTRMEDEGLFAAAAEKPGEQGTSGSLENVGDDGSERKRILQRLRGSLADLPGGGTAEYFADKQEEIARDIERAKRWETGSA